MTKLVLEGILEISELCEGAAGFQAAPEVARLRVLAGITGASRTFRLEWAATLGRLRLRRRIQARWQAMGDRRRADAPDHEGQPTPGRGPSGWVATGRLRWRVPPDRSGLGSRLLADAAFPWEEILQTRALGAAGGVMVDVGANIGTTAVPRLRLGHFRAAFLAEPEPRNFEALRENLHANDVADRAFPRRLAITDRNGEGWLSLSKNMGNHYLRARREGGRGDVPVRLATLKSWGREQRIPWEEVTFVKLDAQGAEAGILRGAQELASDPRIVWQVEFSPTHLRRQGADPDLFAEVLSAGFAHFVDIGKGVNRPRSRDARGLPRHLRGLGRGLPGRRFTNLVLSHRPFPI